MLRIVWAVIIGFVLWSALWVGSDSLLLILSPEWYGEGIKNFSTSILLISLVKSIVISLFCGYIAALVGRNHSMSAVLVLGVLLLGFGIFIQMQFWNVIPLWYHIIFLGLLIPITWLGGRLRTA